MRTSIGRLMKFASRRFGARHFAGGFACGAIGGAAAMLLISPKSRVRLMRRIGAKARLVRSAIDSVQSNAEDIADHARELASSHGTRIARALRPMIART
jgi:gas vesicle protein